MAKRIIHECDLTKQEFDPQNEKVFTLSIAIKGKKAPMKYELGAAAAEKLLSQLNSSNELEEDWSFSNGDYAPAVDNSHERRTLEDLEAEASSQEKTIEDDSRFVSEKRASLREQGVLDDEESTDSPVEKTLNATKGCTHMNKGRIQTTIRDGKRLIYRKCNDCRKSIAEITADARQQYMSGKAPKGVNIKDL